MKTDSFTWHLPAPRSAHDVQMEDGTVVKLRRHGNPAGTRLVLSHGNGLAIDLYYPFWSLFTGEFDLFIYDLRNHGWNTVGSQSEHNLLSFVKDHDRILEVIDEEFGEKPKIGVFHSIAALASLLSNNHENGLAARILFDPPIVIPDDCAEEYDKAARRSTEIILRRAERFNSIEECVDIFHYMPIFGRVVPGVINLFARTTFRKSEDKGDYELRCPREYEAQVMYYARIFTLWVDLDKIPTPVKVIGADPTLPYSFLPTYNLGQIAAVDYDFLPDTTHLLQLEQPEECKAMVQEFLKHHNLLY